MNKLSDGQLKWLTKQTGRSNGQTQFLFSLVREDLNELKRLETHIKNSFVYFCPDTMVEVEEVYKRELLTDMFGFDED